MFAIAHDLRYALRTLRRSPGFTAIAVTALALGIGAATTIFSVVDAVLVRPMPYAQPDRLVQIWSQNLERGISFYSTPYPDVAVWRTDARSFDALGAQAVSSASLATSAGEPESVSVSRVTASFFPVFGTRMAIGRAFLDAEDAPGGPHAAVLDHDLWRRRFGADPAEVGRQIRLDGEAYTVIGVLPAGFEAPFGPCDVFTPLAQSGVEGQPYDSVQVFGRLAPGATVRTAQAEIDAISARLDAEFPQRGGRSVRVWGLREFRTRDVRASLLVLAAAVAAVLLIACVNVANLLLSRAGLRRREMAVRAALGAGRGRLVSQLLTENLLLGFVGGAAGLLLAWWAIGAIHWLSPAGLPDIDRAALDGRALLAAIAASGLTGLLFGTTPALAQSRFAGAATLDATLREDGRRAGGGGRRRLRSGLVVGEVALSLVLLVGAGLLIQSLYRTQQVKPGFDAGGMLTASVSLRAERYQDEAARAAFFQRFLGALEAAPGVTSAGVVSTLPFSGTNTGILLVGERGAILEPDGAPVVWFRRASDDYFRTMRIPLVRGRLFRPEDERTDGVSIVNETLAARFWPGEDPIGQRLRVPARPGSAQPVRWLTVVGVVGDVHHWSLTRPPQPEIFWPLSSGPPDRAAVVIRTALDPSAVAPILTRVAARIDPEQAVSRVQTMTAMLDRTLARGRLSTGLMMSFAALALVLAVVGLYGVISVHGGPARARDWDPHGARRRPRRRAEDGPARGARDGAGGRGRRDRRRARGDAPDDDDALRHVGDRRRHLRGGGGPARRRVAGRRAGAGAPRERH